MKPYTHFTLKERIYIDECLKQNVKLSKIADNLGKDRTSVWREIKRNSNAEGTYNSWGANSKSSKRRKHSVRHKRIIKDSQLYKFIVEKLNLFWSPELIAQKWNEANPDDRIAFGTIYRALKNKFFDGITVKTHLRRRGKRVIRNRSKCAGIQPEHTIHERSSIIEKRERCGDWEGDTVHGAMGKGGLLTLVDRKSRKLLARLVTDFSSDTIYKAVIEVFKGIKPKSITFDNGNEFARFKDMEKALDTTIYFADPHSPWQRGSNENINGLLRFFFPKRFNFLEISQENVDRVISLINSRPRACLDFLSPDDVFCCT